MEITKEQIIEAFKSNPDLITGVMPTLEESEVVKSIINNKVDSIYKLKIDEEVKNIHKKYDDDLFEILGERPGQREDGTKEKTFEKLKNLYGELKGLRGRKEGLTKEAEVQRLMGEIEKLKSGSGAEQVQQMFDQAKTQWGATEDGYKDQIKGLEDSRTSHLKETPINQALSQIKFTPETPESVRKMVMQTVKEQLKANSELRDGKLVFLKEDGQISLNGKYEPMTAFEKMMTMESIKDISLKEDSQKGGGADPTIEGSIITTSVEGKDVKKLNLTPGSFKTKSDFITVSEKALTDAGFTVRDKEWDTLKTEAYKEHKVSELPAQ